MRVLPQLAGVVVLALAGAALAGAALGLEALEAPIRPATAAAVIALGLALLVGGRLGRGLAALAGAGGVVGLALERMGPHSGVAIALLGVALVVLDVENARRGHPAEALAGAAGAAALLSLVSQLYGRASSRPLSAVLLLLLAGGVLCARPARGWMAVITGPGPGGVTARRLLPAAVLAPVGLGGLRVAGERLGWYAGPTGSAWLVVATVVLFALFVLVHARKLDAGEARLAATNRFLDAIIDAIPDMIFMKDATRLGFVRLNRAGEELLGLAQAELLGKTDYDFFDAEQAAFFQAKDRETLARGALVDIDEEPIATKHGPRWLHTRKVPLVGPDGEFLLGISEDITERRRVEEERRRWASIFEHAHWAVATIGAGAPTLELSNPAFARLHGFEPGELDGQPVTRVVADDEHAGFAAALARADAAGQHTFESRHVRKDGTVFAALVNATAVKDPGGGLAFRALAVQDVTPLKRTEQELRAAKEAAEATSRELEAFSYSVSHDLRAPLRSIDGFSQALLEDYGDKLDAAGLGYVGRVRAAAQRMAHLIDDLLELSRVARTELRRERLDLSALARFVAAELALGEPGRHVSFRAQPGLVATGDPRLLQVVLTNLVGNAWKFTAKQPAAKIEVGRDGAGFYVRDDGAGFDMAYAAQLFGAFQRLHGSAEFPGTGIGLATVQRIVHRHGGRVWAEGAVGAGATFHFTLPEIAEEKP